MDHDPIDSSQPPTTQPASQSTAAAEPTAADAPESTATAAATAAADAERLEKLHRQRLAAERRAKIMAQMKSAQTNFMSSNAELFRNTDTNTNASSTVQPPASGGSMDWQPDAPTATAAADAEPVAVRACLGAGVRAHPVPAVPDDEYTCILCSEDVLVTTETPTSMVYSAYVQMSKVMAYTNQLQQYSTHVSSCGHVMHAQCWQKYFDSEVLKESRRPNRQRTPGTFQIDRKEFLCPMCRCLSNCVLPIATALSNYAQEQPTAKRTETGGEEEAAGGEEEAAGGERGRDEEEGGEKGPAQPIGFRAWLDMMHK